MQAVADFTTVLKLDPTNVNAFFNRGSAYDSLGQYEKAVADYTHALDLDSSSADPDQSAGESVDAGHAWHQNTVCQQYIDTILINESVILPALQAA